MYDVIDSRLCDEDGCPVNFTESPHQSGNFKPEGIILHDTAGPLMPIGGTARWFANPRAKVSAHFNIERDGTVWQCVELDRKAWHAGQSVYRGRRNVNGFAFGIELVNPGKMTPINRGGRSWWGKEFRDDDHQGQYEEGKWDLSTTNTMEHGFGCFMHYTPEQIETTIEVCRALAEEFDLKWISTHWFISPGRKVDTNPLFPLDHVRSRVFGRGDPPPLTDKDGKELFGDAQVIVGANVREWPHLTSKIVTVAGRNSRLDVIRSGFYESEEGHMEQWHLCETESGHEGFIHSMLVDLD